MIRRTRQKKNRTDQTKKKKRKKKKKTERRRVSDLVKNQATLAGEAPFLATVAFKPDATGYAPRYARVLCLCL